MKGITNTNAYGNIAVVSPMANGAKNYVFLYTGKVGGHDIPGKGFFKVQFGGSGPALNGERWNWVMV